MLWHHLIVEQKLVRSIYEPFGEQAKPILVEAIKAFPEYAYEIAHCTLIGASDPYANREERIISVYNPSAPEWYNGPADHHAMKLHVDSGKVEWKILWTAAVKKPKLDVPGNCFWVGQNFDENMEETDEYHEYYDHVNPRNPRDLIGYTCDKDLNIKHTKLYVHPHWVTQGDYLVTNWDHMPKMKLPTDIIPLDYTEKTRGNIWIN